MSRRLGIRRPLAAGHRGPLTKAAAPTSLPGGLALPSGSTVTDGSSLLGQLQGRTHNAISGATPLPRDQGFTALMGPGAPLYPSPFNQPNPQTGQADPRRYQYEVSHNLLSNDRPVPWAMLRTAADKVDIIRLCLRTRKDELTQLEWGFGFTADAEQQLGITSVAAKRDMRDKYSAQFAKLKNFWSIPDKTNDLSWSEWLGMLLEERFVLDALSIYPRHTYGGDLASLEVIDGSTVKPLIDEYGNRPIPPAPAYQQWLYGFPRGEYTDNGASDTWEGTAGSLIYKPYTRRTHSPYGFPEVEQALLSAEVYLRRQDWMRQEYTAGTLPTTWMKTDAALGQLTPEQYRAWDVALNDFLRGSTSNRHEARMLPAGFDPVATTDVSERYKADYDEFLVKLLCAHMATQPSEIGFTPSNGLGGAGFSDAQEDVTYRKSLRPTLSWLVDIVNSISSQYLGMPPELTMQFLGMESEDEEAADKVAQARVQGARMTLNEDRDRTGQPRYTFPEADMPMLMTQRGIVFIEKASETTPPGEMISPAQAPQATSSPEGPDAEEGPVAPVVAARQKKQTAKQGGEQPGEAAKAELAAYRNWARKDHKRPFEFTTLTKADAETAGVDLTRVVFKAGDAGPKLRTGRTWPGWSRDLAVAKHWAPKLSQALTGAVNARGLAEHWLSLRKAADPSDAQLWLDAQTLPVAHAIGQTLRSVHTEGYLIGQRSAVSMTAGVDVSWDGWTPGHPEAAEALIGDDIGLRRLLDQSGVTINSIAQHRLDELAQALADGVAGGDSADTLAQALTDVLDDPSWAYMVALTETSRAVSWATLQSYLENGIEASYWLSAEDERVCQDCADNEDAGVTPLNQPFPNGGYQPPAHVQCRCALAPVL